MPDRRKRPLPQKICVHCGRLFSWRKKWERDWEQVRYCSDGCRKAAKRGKMNITGHGGA